MPITPDTVLAAVASALGKPVDLDPGTPLIESGAGVNSLTMLTILSTLERQAGMEIPQDDLIRLSAGSIHDIAGWFRANAPAPAVEAEP